MVTPSMWRKMVQVYRMTPVLLVDSSTLFTGIGFAILVLRILCFFTKSQSMQERSALLSTRAQVSMVFSDCPGMRT